MQEKAEVIAHSIRGVRPGLNKGNKKNPALSGLGLES